MTAAQKGEILMMYRQAADRKKQISIMADLFLCTKQDIKQVLIEAGLLSDNAKLPQFETERKSEKRGTLWTDEEESLLCELKKEGYKYKDIGVILGRSQQSIANKAFALGI